MSRREFSKAVQREAFIRCNGKCEGENCGAHLYVGGFHYDHIIPDGNGGTPTLDNCQVLCKPCHKVKTCTIDVPSIAKTKRIIDRQRGIKKPSRFPSARNSIWKKKVDGSVVRR